MPPSLQRRSTKCLAETNRIRQQMEQLRYHCECIDPLNDTRDARWISLISMTMRHAVLIRRITWQKQGQGPFHTAGHEIPSNWVSSVGRLKPNAENRDTFQLTRNSLDTFAQETNVATRLAVTTEKPVATWMGNVFKIACACSSHAMRDQTRLLNIKNKFPWKHTKLRAGINWQSWHIATDASNVSREYQKTWYSIKSGPDKMTRVQNWKMGSERKITRCTIIHGWRHRRKNCRETKFVELENKKWNICATSEWMKKLDVKQSQSIKSFQSTRSGSTQTWSIRGLTRHDETWLHLSHVSTPRVERERERVQSRAMDVQRKGRTSFVQWTILLFVTIKVKSPWAWEVVFCMLWKREDTVATARNTPIFDRLFFSRCCLDVVTWLHVLSFHRDLLLHVLVSLSLSIREGLHAYQVTNCGKRFQKWRSAESVHSYSAVGSVEGTNPYRSE